MDEKEFKALQEKVLEEVKGYNETLKAIQKQLDEDGTKDELEKLDKKAQEQTDTITKISEQLDAIQIKMKDQKRAGENWFVKLAKDLQTDDFKKSMKAKGGSFEMVITGDPYSLLKVGTMTIDPNLGALDLDTAVILPMRESGVAKAPDRPTTIIDIWMKGNTGSNQVTWVERTARTDGAAAVAEGGTFGQSDYTWNLKKTPVEKIATYVKVSNESLEDWEFTLSEIRTEVFGQLDRKLEQQTWSGTGTTPQLDGITNNAVAYTYSGLDGKVASPNTFDAIKAMATQARVAYFHPTHVILNPADAAEMMMTKDDNNQYLALSAQATGLIGGLQIVESTLMTAGSAMVCEAAKAGLFLRKNITIELFDQDQTDAIKDLKTITGKVRAAFRVKLAHYAAFVYDAISDVTTLIAKS